MDRRRTQYNKVSLADGRLWTSSLDAFVRAGLGNPQLDRRVVMALELLLQRHESGLATSVNELAVQANISVSRFRHVFKAQTGFAPAHFAKVVRLCRAKHLLQNTFLSVKQVSAELGIDDVSHFVRDFQRMFGQSPAQTRRHNLPI